MSLKEKGLNSKTATASPLAICDMQRALPDTMFISKQSETTWKDSIVEVTDWLKDFRNGNHIISQLQMQSVVIMWQKLYDTHPYW